jgi:CRP-like cAMP-binding protein
VNSGEAIYRRDQPARFWYRIVNGVARKCVLTPEGRRQIVDFLLPGDVFGFGSREVHHFTTEAITSGTLVCRYPRESAAKLASEDPQVACWIREVAFAAIARLQSRTVIIGRVSAVARLSAFLLEWSDRCASSPGESISLPMSRYDVADHLALAVETISRAFTYLRTQHLIICEGTRFFSICNSAALLMASQDQELDSVLD